MGIYFSKQPNNRYCRFSSIVDCPTHINMTFDDLVYVLAQQYNNKSISIVEMATQIVDYQLRPFKDVINDFQPMNITSQKFLNCIEKMFNDNAVFEVIDNSPQAEIDNELTINQYTENPDVYEEKLKVVKELALTMVKEFDSKKQISRK